MQCSIKPLTPAARPNNSFYVLSRGGIRLTRPVAPWPEYVVESRQYCPGQKSIWRRILDPRVPRRDPVVALPMPLFKNVFQGDVTASANNRLIEGRSCVHELVSLKPVFPVLPRIEGGLKLCARCEMPWWASLFEAGEDFTACLCHDLPLVVEYSRVIGTHNVTARTGNLVLIDDHYEPNHQFRNASAEVYVRISPELGWFRSALMNLFLDSSDVNECCYGSVVVDMSFCLWRDEFSGTSASCSTYAFSDFLYRAHTKNKGFSVVSNRLGFVLSYPWYLDRKHLEEGVPSASASQWESPEPVHVHPLEICPGPLERAPGFGPLDRKSVV